MHFPCFIISCIIISTDEDLSLRLESFAILNLRGVSTKLYFDFPVLCRRNILKLQKRYLVEGRAKFNFGDELSRLPFNVPRTSTYRVYSAVKETPWFCSSVVRCRLQTEILPWYQRNRPIKGKEIVNRL